MVIRGYCIEIVLKFYFRDIFVYKIGIQIISKIYPGLWIVQTPLIGPQLSATVKMKATEQYFPVVLFIMLYMVVLTFESVDEILKCDHSNESY